MRFSYIFLFTLAASACTGLSAPGETTPSETVALNIADLYRHWMHSIEEDRGDTLVYRPADARMFPPSRFRMEYVFREDGTVDWHWLAPNDAHRMREGTWEFDADDPDVIHIQQDEERVSYRILKLTEDLLLFKR